MNCSVLRWMFCLSLIAHFSISGRIPEILVDSVVKRNGEWPFLIAVYYENRYTCIFSLITTQTSLGAASCLYNKSILFFYGKVGNNIRSRGNIIEFANYTIHNEYDPETGHDNIAMLTLDKPITASRFVAPVRLPHINTFTNIWRSAVTAGFRLPEPFSHTDVDLFLREVPLTLLYTNEHCAEYNITNKELCVFYEEQIILLKREDLGAPLVRKYGDIKVLIGIRSRQFHYSTRFEVFTSTQYYYEWIKENCIGVLSFY